MAEILEVLCPVCDHKVGTKEDGTKVKAHKIRGVKCEGSDEEVTPDMEVGSTGDVTSVDKGESYETLDGAQDDELSDDDETDPDDENEPEASAQSAEDAGSYEWTLTVKQPCPFVHEEVWHTANMRLAERAATDAGRTVAGKTEHAGSEDLGETLRLTYRVPVK